jgi:hypothetical protein
MPTRPSKRDDLIVSLGPKRAATTDTWLVTQIDDVLRERYVDTILSITLSPTANAGIIVADGPRHNTWQVIVLDINPDDHSVRYAATPFGDRNIAETFGASQKKILKRLARKIVMILDRSPPPPPDRYTRRVRSRARSSPTGRRRCRSGYTRSTRGTR